MKEDKSRLTVDRVGADVIIRVRDTGSGIPPDLLPNVFDLFTQGDRTLSRSRGGLGIGLTLVRSLIELHGGQVTAHSEGLGKGSEFVVRLPAAASSPKAPRASLRTICRDASSYRAGEFWSSMTSEAMPRACDSCSRPWARTSSRPSTAWRPFSWREASPRRRLAGHRTPAHGRLRGGSPMPRRTGPGS